MGVFPTTKTITIEVPKDLSPHIRLQLPNHIGKNRTSSNRLYSFNVRVDQKRVVNVDPTNVQLSKIAYPETATSVELGLPNSEKAIEPVAGIIPWQSFPSV